MVTFAVLMIIGMVVIMIFCMAIDRMDANDNLKSILAMIVVKMN